MKKKLSFNTPRFQIVFFDVTFKTGLIKIYDKNRKVIGKYKEYFENGEISEACQRVIKNIEDISILFENKEMKNECTQ